MTSEVFDRITHSPDRLGGRPFRSRWASTSNGSLQPGDHRHDRRDAAPGWVLDVSAELHTRRGLWCAAAPRPSRLWFGGGSREADPVARRIQHVLHIDQGWRPSGGASTGSASSTAGGHPPHHPPCHIAGPPSL